MDVAVESVDCSSARTHQADPVTHWHCLGIGGMGMAPLALFLAAKGHRISGTDRMIPAVLKEHFARAGIRVGEEDEGLPEEARGVVHSSAIAVDHPVIEEARKRGLPVCRRGELLARVAQGYRLLAVVGAHGKTTTSMLLAEGLRAMGQPFNAILGGLSRDPDCSPATYHPDSSWLIAEVDESDGTIEDFAPELTLVVNLDWDHCDHYRDEASLMDAFARLVARTRGKVLLPTTCPRAKRMAERWADDGKPVVTYGPDGAHPIRGRADGPWGVTLRKADGPEVFLRLPGEFNARNAEGAWAALEEMGLTFRGEGWANFSGIRRRQDVLRQDEGMTILHDYAHHPAEIAAFMEWAEAVREQEKRSRLVVVFQSHRFSRTRQFGAEFAQLLGRADKLFLLETYAASELPLDGGRAADLAALVPSEGELKPILLPGSAKAAATPIAAALQEGDLVLFIGAGDIEETARAVTRQREETVWQHWWDGFVQRNGGSGETVFRREEELARKTTLRVGGKALFYAEPEDEAILCRLLSEANRVGVPVFILGRGSNLIIPAEGFRGLVIRLQHPFWREVTAMEGGLIKARTGVRLRQLCGEACQQGWAGLEFLEGIPGTLGGALRMNAGAMGGWTFDVVKRVRYATLDGQIHEVDREELQVGYRHCRELETAIALEAILQAPEASTAEVIKKQLKDYMTKRTASQPKEPSAGCIFKNPEGDSAGRLIDQLGLKGWREGAAEVSLVHGNFIINRGGATAEEVVRLVRKIRREVERRTGIRLEPEVLLPGHRWEEVL